MPTLITSQLVAVKDSFDLNTLLTTYSVDGDRFTNPVVADPKQSYKTAFLEFDPSYELSDITSQDRDIWASVSSYFSLLQDYLTSGGYVWLVVDNSDLIGFFACNVTQIPYMGKFYNGVHNVLLVNLRSDARSIDKSNFVEFFGKFLPKFDWVLWASNSLSTYRSLYDNWLDRYESDFNAAVGSFKISSGTFYLAVFNPEFPPQVIVDLVQRRVLKSSVGSFSRVDPATRSYVLSVAGYPAMSFMFTRVAFRRLWPGARLFRPVQARYGSGLSLQLVESYSSLSRSLAPPSVLLISSLHPIKSVEALYRLVDLQDPSLSRLSTPIITDPAKSYETLTLELDPKNTDVPPNRLEYAKLWANFQCYIDYFAQIITEGYDLFAVMQDSLLLGFFWGLVESPPAPLESIPPGVHNIGLLNVRNDNQRVSHADFDEFFIKYLPSDNHAWAYWVAGPSCQHKANYSSWIDYYNKLRPGSAASATASGSTVYCVSFLDNFTGASLLSTFTSTSPTAVDQDGIFLSSKTSVIFPSKGSSGGNYSDWLDFLHQYGVPRSISSISSVPDLSIQTPIRSAFPSDSTSVTSKLPMVFPILSGRGYVIHPDGRVDSDINYDHTWSILENPVKYGLDKDTFAYITDDTEFDPAEILQPFLDAGNIRVTAFAPDIYFQAESWNSRNLGYVYDFLSAHPEFTKTYLYDSYDDNVWVGPSSQFTGDPGDIHSSVIQSSFAAITSLDDAQAWLKTLPEDSQLWQPTDSSANAEFLADYSAAASNVSTVVKDFLTVIRQGGIGFVFYYGESLAGFFTAIPHNAFFQSKVYRGLTDLSLVASGGLAPSGHNISYADVVTLIYSLLGDYDYLLWSAVEGSKLDRTYSAFVTRCSGERLSTDCGACFIVTNRVSDPDFLLQNFLKESLSGGSIKMAFDPVRPRLFNGDSLRRDYFGFTRQFHSVSLVPIYSNVKALLGSDLYKTFSAGAVLDSWGSSVREFSFPKCSKKSPVFSASTCRSSSASMGSANSQGFPRNSRSRSVSVGSSSGLHRLSQSSSSAPAEHRDPSEYLDPINSLSGPFDSETSSNLLGKDLIMLDTSQSQLITSKTAQWLLDAEDPEFLHRTERLAELTDPVIGKVQAGNIEFWVDSSNYDSNGVTYQVFVMFVDLWPLIQKDTFEQDLADIIKEDNILISCTCASNQYAGFNYLATQLEYSYPGFEESRYPVERNPYLRSTTCKHGHKVLEWMLNPANLPVMVQAFKAVRDQLPSTPKSEVSQTPSGAFGETGAAPLYELENTSAPDQQDLIRKAKRNYARRQKYAADRAAEGRSVRPYTPRGEKGLEYLESPESPESAETLDADLAGEFAGALNELAGGSSESSGSSPESGNTRAPASRSAIKNAITSAVYKPTPLNVDVQYSDMTFNDLTGSGSGSGGNGFGI